MKQNAVQNVISEVELLRAVDHPFVVSLWYTFQVKNRKKERKKERERDVYIVGFQGVIHQGGLVPVL